MMDSSGRFNAELGSSRTNSLRMAIQLWDKARSCYGFPDCTAHPTQKEEADGTGS